MQNHIVGIYAFSLYCVSSNAPSNCMHARMHSHTVFICLTFFRHFFLQMCFQTDFCCWGILTLIAFVLLFSIMYFQMCPQIGFPRKWEVTLIAFVWPLSAVHFQMVLQTGWISGGMIKMCTFMRLVPTVWFQMCPLMCSGWINVYSQWLHFFDFAPLHYGFSYFIFFSSIQYCDLKFHQKLLKPFLLDRQLPKDYAKSNMTNICRDIHKKHEGVAS